MSLHPTSPKLAVQEQSLLPQTRNSCFPVTPIKSQEGAKQKTTTPRNGPSTPTSTIRERRGRRQYLANGDFHPLSIFTKSALFPFHLDSEKALEILKSDSPDRLEEAKNASGREELKVDLLGEETQQENKSPEKCTPPLKTPALRTSMQSVAYCSNSDMDLITALKVTSPEKDFAPKLHADFATLCELPIPEPSQHPAFLSNPFDVRTDAPLLFTSTSTDEIRLFNPKNSRRSSSSKFGRESVERKRSFFGLDFKTPSSARSRNAFSSLDDSPLPLNVPTPNSGNTFGSLKGSSPFHAEYNTPKESSSSQSTTNSVRKFSDLFRTRNSIERSLDSLPHTPPSSQDSPHLARYDLVCIYSCTSSSSTTLT